MNSVVLFSRFNPVRDILAGRYLIAKKRYDLAIQTIRLLAERAIKGDDASAEQVVRLGIQTLEAMGYRTRRSAHEVVLSGRPEWLVGVSDSMENAAGEFAEGLASVLTMIADPEMRDAKARANRWRWIDHTLGAVEDFLVTFNRINRDAGDRFRHGPFNVVLLSDALTPQLQKTLDLLDAVSARIRPHAPQVLYGNVFVTDETIVREGARAAGVYRSGSDSIALALGVHMDGDDVYVLAHEFGHRFEHKFLKDPEREEFITLSLRGDPQSRVFTLAEREHAVDEWIALWDAIRKDETSGPVDDLAHDWYGAFSDVDRPLFKTYVLPLIRKYRDDGDDTVLPALRKELGRLDVGAPITYPTNPRPEPVWASMYGGKNWHENFAEAFAYHVMGKTLPEPLADLMKRILG